MSLYFLINNFTFAFGMVGAIVFIMAGWLSFDAYRIRHDFTVLSRGIGFSLIALWQIIHAMAIGSDVLSYIGILLYIVGLAFALSSFFRKSDLVMNAIIVIPAFTIWDRHLYGVSALLIFVVAYCGWRQWKREQNRTWIPFSVSFVLIGLGSIFGIFAKSVETIGLFSIAHLVVELAGFVVLGYWVWQYMQLRIRESIVMGLVGTTFLLATVVTLAFSTILISRVSLETAHNLVTDARVLNVTIESLRGEALAKVTSSATETGLAQALDKEDLNTLNQIAERILEGKDLGFVTIAHVTGEVLVRAHALSRRGDTLLGERAFEEGSRGVSFSTIEESPVEGLSVRASAPIMKAGKVIGVIVGGYPLDNAFADNMKRLTGLEMFVYTKDASVAATAFANDGVTRLVGASIADEDIRSSVFDSGKAVSGEVTIYGEEFQASYLPLVNGDGKTVGALSVAKRQGDIVMIANATNRLTLVTVVLIILALLLPVYSLSKRFESAV